MIQMLTNTEWEQTNDILESKVPSSIDGIIFLEDLFIKKYLSFLSKLDNNLE